jgi:hypothetical protein
LVKTRGGTNLATPNKYRSGLEKNIGSDLDAKGVPYDYESSTLSWSIEEVRNYLPDFHLPNGIIIEAKGRFTTYDRKKHLAIKKQHPELDIRFVFSNSRGKIYKGSKTTYGQWCDRHGFKYADKLIPQEWLDE